MALETTNTGFQAAQGYFLDPEALAVPDETHQEHMQGLISYIIGLLPTDTTSTLDERLGKVDSRLGAFMLKMAVQEGFTKFGMIDSLIDEFEDETGVNTGSSSNQNYSSTDDFYEPTPSVPATLLLQSEAANGNTTDISAGTASANTDSTGNYTFTSEGSFQNSTAQAKYGSSSFEFNGTNSYLRGTDPGDNSLDPESGDFTLTLWARHNSNSGTHYAVDKFGGSTNFGYAVRFNNGIPQFYFSTTGSNIITRSLSGGSLPTGVWYHLAFCRNGNNLYSYLDGSLKDTYDLTGVGIYNTTEVFKVGRSNIASGYWNGNIEEVFFAKGVASYDGTNFTPPATPFSLSTLDMTLVGASDTAASSPTYARAVVLYRPIDSSTINTDCVLRVSKDGGSTPVNFTMSYDEDFDDNIQILTTDEVTLPTGSGTSMVWEFLTQNNKDQRIYGIWLQWR